MAVLLGLSLLFPSCKSVQYIPAETAKIHHRDHLVRDSVFRYDSVFVRQKADTILLERYRYVYKNNIVTDSVFINDSIRISFLVLLLGSVYFVSKIRL